LRPVPDIVCLSTNHWSGLATSKTHLMKILSGSGRVLFVEPPVDLFSVLGRRRRWAKLSGLRRVGDGPWVLPAVAPSSHRSTRWLRDYHARRIGAVRAAQERLRLERPVVWAFGPEHVEYAGKLGESLLVYHVADEPSSLVRDPDEARAADREMVAKADVVFAVSERLARDRRTRGRTRRLRNAADRRHYAGVLSGDPDADIDEFTEALKRAARPPELRAVDGPVILFGGAAYDWFDVGLLAGAAAERPEWTFALVGPKGERVARAALPGNVLAIGRRPYSEFPRYVASADATFIPVRKGETYDTCDPIVVYEYLLCGKQVVATPFPAASEHGGLVRTAGDVRGFVSEMEAALEDAGDASEVRRRVEYGFANTWENRAALAVGVLNSALGRGSTGQTSARDGAHAEDAEVA